MSNFRIIPGMSCWGEMPSKYKKAYFDSLPKPLSLNEKNQKKLDKIWLADIKKEKRIEKNYINWMD